MIVEDLAVAAMLKNRRLARSISDAGWASFTSMLEYKAARYGRTFHRINRFEPTTQNCSTCGARTGPKGQSQLHVRMWACGNCGTHHDRDLNAATNILAAGRAERLNASGDQVRPGRARTTPVLVSERGTHQSDRLRAKPAPTGVVGIPAL